MGIEVNDDWVQELYVCTGAVWAAQASDTQWESYFLIITIITIALFGYLTDSTADVGEYQTNGCNWQMGLL